MRIERPVYALCLVSIVSLGGYAWRMGRFYVRGIEQAGQGQVERRPGINVELVQYTPAELDAVLADVASLGFYWLRQRFPWPEIEPQPGIYRWAQWDALVAAVRRHGLALIAVLDTAPAWAVRHHPFPMPCLPPYDEAAYARFASAFAGRYGDWIDHYQVWDEPNLSHHWEGGHVAPCGYAQLLQAAHGAIHAVDPTAWVLGGGLAPTQAPGPDNLNDWTYLRQLYAAGGGAYLDILAVKPYGFWSGPQDRRIAPDVLNFSRVVALREFLRAAGDGAKPIWAVEWGWNVLPARWAGAPPPWGSDTIAEQAPRIAGAASRARAEWPWMGPLCWATYQPDVPPTDPHWGFALRGSDGAPTPLYDVLRALAEAPLPASAPPLRVPAYLALSWPLLAVASLGLILPWWDGIWRRAARQAWCQFASLSSACHIGLLLALAALYAFTPALEWILIAWASAFLVFYLHPHWALVGAAFSIPFVYLAKPIGNWHVLPAEALLLLATGTAAVRRARTYGVALAHRWAAGRRDTPEDGGLSRGRPGSRSGRSSPLSSLLPPPYSLLLTSYSLLLTSYSLSDLAWGLWLIVGACSLPVAPDRALAFHEWRAYMLGPALLFALIRLRAAWMPGPASPRMQEVLLLAWIASGVAVALVGVGQWLAGALVPAGSVGRAMGVYYSPNHMALYLERILPLPLALALCGWNAPGSMGIWRSPSSSAGRWRRVACMVTIVLAAGLYLTYSRGAWLLAVPVALSILGGLCWRQWRWWTAASVAIGLALALWGVLHGRAASSLAEEIRIPVWQSAVAMIADRPWRGVGLDGFQFVYPRYMRAEAWAEPLLYHPHNVWLDAAVRLGLPGTAVFLALVGSCLWGIGRPLPRASAWQQAIRAGLLAGLGAGLAHGMVDSGYFIGDLAWSLALAAGIGSIHPGSRCDSHF